MKKIEGSRQILELGLLLAGAGLAFLLSRRYDVLEGLVAFSRAHEALELDELLPTSVVLCLGLLVFVFRRWREKRVMERALRSRNRDLEAAAKKIRTLEGMLSICSGCKKVRNEKGKWEHVDTYVEAHSKAVFSHSMCPDCMESYYGDADWFKTGGDPEDG